MKKDGVYKSWNWIKQLITVLGALGVVGTLLIALGTLKEMKEQRVKAYEPKIVILDNQKFHLWSKYETIDTNYFNYIQIYSFNEKPDSTVFERSKYGWYMKYPYKNNTFNLKLANIGLGTASDVKLEWDFDKRKIAQLYNSDRSIPFLKEVIVETDTIHFISMRDTLRYEFLDKDNSIQFILPYENSSSSIYELNIPEIYFQMWSFYISWLQSKHLHAVFEQNKDEFPFLIMQLQYSDINNKHYKDSYTLKLKTTSGGGNIYEMYFEGKVNISQ